MDYKEKADNIKRTLALVNYDLGLFDSVNFSAVVILCCLMKEVGDDELDIYGEMVVGCESDLINDRLSDAFFDRRLREQFILELEQREEYELLDAFLG